VREVYEDGIGKVFIDDMMDRVTRIGELGTTLEVTSKEACCSPILVTLMMEARISSETFIPTRGTRYNLPEDAILHSHSHENLKSYIALTGWTL
jgi:hypothetical protein